jgi:prolyl oligopeptidase
MRVEQRFATSKDGTRVPYFVVWPKGAKADGRNPTLLYGYGGFEVSHAARYSGSDGPGLAGPGRRLRAGQHPRRRRVRPRLAPGRRPGHKQKSYDDFAAVAEDLIASRRHPPAHLGIQGGSNGGLLVGAVMLQRPELFNAVVCQVPLLDMRRYHRLLAGASWMAEYGDPDKPEDWAFISRYSPYQNVKPGVKLPRCCSPPARATTACTPATRARWRRACWSRATRCCTGRTSKAATAARPTTPSARACGAGVHLPVAAAGRR